MSELPKKIHDDKNGLDYTLCGDYYLLDLGVEPGYPMVEALYDCCDSMCQAFSACYVDIDSMSAYKTRSGDNNPIASSHMDILAWKNALNVFKLRVGCLFERPSLSFSEYR